MTHALFRSSRRRGKRLLHRTRRRLTFERLESRRLLAAAALIGDALALEGEDGADQFVVDLAAGTVAHNGDVTLIDSAAVARIVIRGNGGDDSLQFLAAGWRRPQPMSVEFDGGDGQDFATLTGTAGDDLAELWPLGGTLLGLAYTATVADIERIDAVSGGGQDRADFYDSAGNDQFVATPSLARMSGDGYANSAAGVARVYGHSTGGSDAADLYDAPQDDRFYGSAAFSKLWGGGFYLEAIGFESVYGRGTSGGQDRADLFDSAAADTLTASQRESVLYGPGFYNHVQAFDYVYGWAGGGDRAELLGSQGGDSFYGRGGYAYATSADYYNFAQGFAAVAGGVEEGRDVLETEVVDYVFSLLGQEERFDYGYYTPGDTTADYALGAPPAPVALLGAVLPRDVIVASEFGRSIQRIAADGAVVWTIDLPNSWPRSVSLSEGVLYYADGNIVHAADPAIGETLRTSVLPHNATFVQVQGDTAVVGYDILNEESVEVFALSPDRTVWTSVFRNPHTAGHARHGFVRDGWLFVADTHRYAVYAVDMATGAKTFSLDVYYPNSVEWLGGTTLLIVEEHGDRVISYDYASGEKRLVLSSPVAMYADLANGPAALSQRQAAAARWWQPEKRLKSASAVAFAGEDTLYAPNFATRVAADSYLVCDTDNHRVALFVGGRVVSSLVNLNSPTQAILVE